MANLQDMLDLIFEKIIKVEGELSYFKDIAAIQDNVSKLEELSKQIPDLNQKLDNINSQLPTIEQTMSDINTKLPEIQENMKNIEELGANIPEIQKNIENLNKEIDSLEDRIGQIGGGGDNWVLLYDKNDPDPNINLGYTKGITGGTSPILNLPKLSGYKKFRFTYYNYNFYQHLILEYTDRTYCVFNFYSNDVFGFNFTNISISMEYLEDKDDYEIGVPQIMTIQTPSNKTSVHLNRNGSYNFTIGRIEASL